MGIVRGRQGCASVWKPSNWFFWWRGAHLVLRKFGQHKDDIHYTRESTEQFDLKPVSDEHFKIRKIKLENQEYEIKEIPTIPFRVNEDPLSEEKAFEGIYDMIDIMGDDPSVTPAQLCHGHKVYRGVDLGVSSNHW